MVKVVNVYIDSVTLLDFIKSTTNNNDYKDLVITDLTVENDDEIAFKAIVSDEIIDRREPIRYRY